MKQKTIAQTASVLAVGNVALQALAFLYRIILSRFAGAEGLGVYRLVNTAYLVMNAGCLSGLTFACARLCAAGEARGGSGRRRAVLRLAGLSFGALLLLCGTVMLSCGDRIARDWLGDARCARAFPFLVACLALTGIENIIKSFCIGLQQVRYAAISEVGEQLVRMVAVTALLYVYHGADYGVISMLIFAGMVVSEVFSAGFLSVVYFRHLRERRTTRGIDRALCRRFFRIALPLCVSALLTNLISSAGSVLLPQRLMAAGLSYREALSALGVVSGMAMPLMLFPIALVSSVCTALLPAVAGAKELGYLDRLRHLIGRALFTVGLIGVPATAVLVPLAPYLSRLLFGQQLPGAYMLLLGLAVTTLYYQMITGSLLNAIGQQNQQVLTAIGSELLQLVLLQRWCARPTLGIYGYLLAMTAAASIAFALNLLFLRRKTQFALRPLRRFGVPAVCGVTLFLWTRIIFTALLRQNFSAGAALIGTVLGAGGLYLGVLHLFGIRPVRYLQVRLGDCAVPQLRLW